jgi:Endonuclease/Exonuclease/phosphatase family
LRRRGIDRPVRIANVPRRRIMVALLAAPWVLWALARTLALDGGHPFVAAISFTPYAAATAIVPIVVALVARQWIVAALAVLALALFALALAPRALDGPQLAAADGPGRPLVVMTANLRFGRADARDVLRLAREHDVDVLSLQELTAAAVQRLDDEGARRLLPGRVLYPGAGASGTGLMARRPLRAVALPQPGGPGQLRAALMLPGGEQLGLVCVHPYPPLSGQAVHDWRAVMRALPAPGAGRRRPAQRARRRLQRDARPPRPAPRAGARLHRRRRRDRRRAASDVPHAAADRDRPRARAGHDPRAADLLLRRHRQRPSGAGRRARAARAVSRPRTPVRRPRVLAQPGDQRGEHRQRDEQGRGAQERGARPASAPAPPATIATRDGARVDLPRLH